LLQGCTGWPVDIITQVPDIESVMDAIHVGPYGRCVYDCDNDVVDSQVNSFDLITSMLSFHLSPKSCVVKGL